ncbi:hypothetical protein B9T31_02745 [Acinetobacter sp. ANC 4558]|uniref:hypothetical protein n=1 Tax=Acinetobacter sp. ANC 4558 TaxID=1977876 RepID=UPI000A34B6D0|nr:hypothetical protein [Acinetobacter sp. ANC 4558]OTG87439.1 hypothetical protein B9T31_02745 [Acinetobacter sp. ANC 4558]
MTEALYLLGATCADVSVLACSLVPNGLFAVQLSATPFHPQGGGQPSDTGNIKDISVEHVAIEGDEIIHYCKQPICLGQAFAQVNEAQRKYYSRLHSAGHLIGHLVQELGWTPIKAQHWPEEAKVQFIKQEHAQEIDLQSLQTQCNQYISDHLQCFIKTNAEGYREVNFGFLPAYPCGGTHVEFLSEIIEITLTESKLKKNKLTIHYKIPDEQQ